MTVHDDIDSGAAAFLRALVERDGPPRKIGRGERPIVKQLDWPSETAESTDYWRMMAEKNFYRHLVHDLRRILVRTIAKRSAPLSERRQAALLYRRGAERGWWDRDPQDVKLFMEVMAMGARAPRVKQACVPAAPSTVEPTKPTTKLRRAKASPLTWADLGPDAKREATRQSTAKTKRKATRGKRRAMSPEMEQAFRLIAANHEFQLAMKDPLANKVEACARLFDTLEREGMGDLVKDARRQALEGKLQ